MKREEVTINGVRTWLTADPIKFTSPDNPEGRSLDKYVGYFSFRRPGVIIGEAVRQSGNIKIFDSMEAALKAAREEARKRINNS